VALFAIFFSLADGEFTVSYQTVIKQTLLHKKKTQVYGQNKRDFSGGTPASERRGHRKCMYSICTIYFRDLWYHNKRRLKFVQNFRCRSLMSQQKLFKVRQCYGLTRCYSPTPTRKNEGEGLPQLPSLRLFSSDLGRHV